MSPSTTDAPARPAGVLALARWWAPSILIGSVGLVAGIASLIAGEPVAVVICLASIVVIAGTSQFRSRSEFRRGWRYGYESAIRAALDYQAGRTPDLEARATVHGDPIPEPWEQHVSPLVTRSSR